MKTTKSKPISPAQLRALHAVCRTANMNEEDRHSMIFSFTSGRTSSSKDLTFDEARILISRLNTQEDERIRNYMRKEGAKLCRAIYALSFDISFLNKGFSSDNEDEKQMNLAKLNVFSRSRSKARKNISQMSLEELTDFKSQLEAIARKEYNED
ncbi:MAG: hypothetical protein WCS17_04030 [Prevotella sp.]